MLELLLNSLVIVHITAGISTLIAGPIAIFYNSSNTQKHKIAGKVFFYAMLLVCVSAIVGFLRKPDYIFYQFLLGLSLIVLIGLFTGIRAIYYMKGKAHTGKVDFVVAIFGLLCGIAMIARAISHWTSNGPLVFTVLLAVFGGIVISDSVKSWQRLKQSHTIAQLTWYKVHISNMIGCFIASSTAFTVNIGQGLPWIVQWFGPMLLLLPVGIYFERQLNKSRMT